MAAWSIQDGRAASPFREWKLKTPINKTLKISQIYPDSPASRLNSFPEKQLRSENFEPLRSSSEAPVALEERKQFYSALRDGFVHSLSLKSQPPPDKFSPISQPGAPSPKLVNCHRRVVSNSGTPKIGKSYHRYRPYSIHDYKNLVIPISGGLGPSDVGSEVWKLKKEKEERRLRYYARLRRS